MNVFRKVTRNLTVLLLVSLLVLLYLGLQGESLSSLASAKPLTELSNTGINQVVYPKHDEDFSVQSLF